jgi:hypothetical protein
VLFLAVLSEVAGSLEISRLTCEYQTEPQSVDSSKPVLGWILKSCQRGQIQTA